jgi:hypothetical protein
LEFDFSRVTRTPKIADSVESLRREINRGLLRFRFDYAKVLGQSFTSETSGFKENDPAGNLADLIEAVNRALQDIHHKGEKDPSPLGVHGVCLFQITAHYCILTPTDLFASG